MTFKGRASENAQNSSKTKLEGEDFNQNILKKNIVDTSGEPAEAMNERTSVFNFQNLPTINPEVIYETEKWTLEDVKNEIIDSPKRKIRFSDYEVGMNFNKIFPKMEINHPGINLSNPQPGSFEFSLS